MLGHFAAANRTLRGNYHLQLVQFVFVMASDA